MESIADCLELVAIFGEIPFEPGVIDAYVDSVWGEE